MEAVDLLRINLADALSQLSAEDIHSMNVYQFAGNVLEVKRRVEGFEGIIKILSASPELLKRSKRRASFMKYARLELEAGEKLLELFATDSRYDRIANREKCMEHRGESTENPWEDFIRFWELEGEELEFIRASQPHED